MAVKNLKSLDHLDLKQILRIDIYMCIIILWSKMQQNEIKSLWKLNLSIYYTKFTKYFYFYNKNNYVSIKNTYLLTCCFLKNWKTYSVSQGAYGRRKCIHRRDTEGRQNGAHFLHQENPNLHFTNISASNRQ